MSNMVIEWTDGFTNRASDGGAANQVECEVSRYIDMGNFSRFQLLYEFEKVTAGTAPTLMFQTSLDKDGPWENLLAGVITLSRASDHLNLSVDDATYPIYRWVKWVISPVSSSPFDVTFKFVALLRR